MPQPRRASRERGNVQPGGRYGTAPDDKRHVEPELEPARGQGFDVRVPEPFPGALTENDAEPKE